MQELQRLSMRKRNFSRPGAGYSKAFFVCPMEILDALISVSGVKDEWEGPEFFPLTESRYIFGTGEIGFFLQTDFTYSENIRKMNDDFWFMMGELSQLGKLDRWENIAFRESEMKQEPWFHRKSGSHIYSLIRNAILLEKKYGRTGL